MDKSIVFLLIILSIDFSLIPVPAADFCPTTTCPAAEISVRFPFRLRGLQPASCGYPGFNLSCNPLNQTIINLPYSGNFTVREIDYFTQNIWINDPDRCLARKLLNLNLSGSPFVGRFYQDFSFFNCTFDHRKYGYDDISCLSDENHAVIATSSQRSVEFLASKCSLITTVAVPVQWDFWEPVTTSDMSEDIRLTWRSPRCGRCEARGGQCGFRSGESGVVECRNASASRLPRGARYAIIVGAGVPAFLCLLGFLCFLCSRLRCYRQPRRHPMLEFSMTVVPQPTAPRSGLDVPTIESYPKTILGESCRLPKPDDKICSICLCEYMEKETLRSIPECQHCFHVECIDEWLRQNASCPVCRNSPKSSPLVLQP